MYTLTFHDLLEDSFVERTVFFATLEERLDCGREVRKFITNMTFESAAHQRAFFSDNDVDYPTALFTLYDKTSNLMVAHVLSSAKRRASAKFVRLLISRVEEGYGTHLNILATARGILRAL